MFSVHDVTDENHHEDLTIVDQLAEFLSGTQAVAFTVISDKDDCYHWVQSVLCEFSYQR